MSRRPSRSWSERSRVGTDGATSTVINTVLDVRAASSRGHRRRSRLDKAQTVVPFPSTPLTNVVPDGRASVILTAVAVDGPMVGDHERVRQAGAGKDRVRRTGLGDRQVRLTSHVGGNGRQVVAELVVEHVAVTRASSWIVPSVSGLMCTLIASWRSQPVRAMPIEHFVRLERIAGTPALHDPRRRGHRKDRHLRRQGVRDHRVQSPSTDRCSSPRGCSGVGPAVASPARSS